MRKLLIAILVVFATVVIIATLIRDRNERFTCADCNIVVVSFDALQAAHVGAYGYPKKTTPTLDEFAKSAYVFENAISPAPWTVPTYISWWTSMFPSEHKVVNRFAVYNPPETKIANLRELTPEAVTLAEVMKRNGYVTVGFTGDAGARGIHGNRIGFDIYIEEPVGFYGFESSVPMALDWISKNKDKKFFMFLHGYDSHGQYSQFGPQEFTGKFLDGPYSGRFTGTTAEQAALREEGLAKGAVDVTAEDVRFWRAWYDEKIWNADARFAAFIQGLKDAGLWDKTIIIVASDHGTAFYEHGTFDHGHILYQENVHVPLMVRFPKLVGGQKIGSLVSTLDIMPTVLDFAGIKPDKKLKAQMKGVSLLPALKGKNISRDVYTETDYRLFTHKRAIVTPDGWKFILTLAEAPDKRNVKELYNLKTDPAETENLVEREPRVAYELEQKVLRHMKDMGTTIEGPWAIGCSAVYNEQCK